MSAIGTRVHCNAMSAIFFDVQSGLYYIGNHASTSISDGRYFVDVNTEFCHDRISF